jgi:septum formation protein
VRRLASEKSAAALDRLRRHGPAQAGEVIVIGADTAVVVDGEILGKPADEAEAAGMLGRLSGRSHEVLTGVSVRRNHRGAAGVETTIVEFAPLTPAEIAWYTGTGEGRDKAGGYAIQGLASRFIPRITGSYSNVVGLPVALVHELVRRVASDR